MKYLMLACAAMLFATGVLAHAQTQQPHDARPNIVLIMADDVSSKVGAFGDTVANTPALDRLASQGVRFTNFYTVTGVCAPSRAAFISGTYPISVGTQHMRTADQNYEAVPPAELKAFPELLRAAGYVTANVAKKDYQFGEPFTLWDVDVGGFMDKPDLAVWRQLPEDKPFFAMITLLSTHESRLAPRKAENDGSAMGGLLPVMGKWVAENVEAVTDPAQVDVPPYLPDNAAVRQSIAQQYDLIHYMDGEVGQVLANLEADGLADNTIVIWTTDNGDGFPRAKRAVLDSGIRLPMIVRFPDGRGAGSVNDAMVSAVDVAPTLLKLAGVDVPGFIQGEDFLDQSQREYIFAARDRMTTVPDRVRAVRDQRFKYIRNYLPEAPYFRPLPFRDMFPIMQALHNGHEQGTLTPTQAFYFEAPRPREELYDTVNDPHEIHNIAGDPDHAQTLARLRGALDQWLEAVGDRGAQPEEDMIRDMWPDREQPVTAAPTAQVSGADDARTVMLASATPGASIGYRVVEQDESTGWQLYTRPVAVKAGQSLQAKAIRYGYQESPVVRANE